MLLLTADSGLLGPISKLFGILMNGIYLGLEKIGFGNIGVAIIIFTLITRLILYPFTVQQQKSSKLMAIIQPEIKAIQSKYEGRQDKQSLMEQQEEIKAVYEKYGTSMTGNCIQLLIQMPIIFALYRVIMNVPAYVNVIKEHFINIVDAIGGVSAIPKIQAFASSDKAIEKIGNTIKGFKDIASKTNVEEQKNLIIDFLYKLNPEQIKQFSSNFSSDAQQVITNEMEYINEANSFCGLNLSTAPSAHGIGLNPYLIIPVLACVTQYFSVVFMQMQTQNKNNENDQINQTMKSMNIMMPIMSAVFCYGFATGIGVYWIASSVFMVITQLIVNAQLKNMNVDDMIKKNVEKANLKRAKKGLPPINAEKASSNIKKMEENSERKLKERENLLNNQKQLMENAGKYYFENENPDSLFTKAGMVQKYNEKHNK